MSRDEAAQDLRNQADACRELARGATSQAGTSALNAFADILDADARRKTPAEVPEA